MAARSEARLFSRLLTLENALGVKRHPEGRDRLYGLKSHKALGH